MSRLLARWKQEIAYGILALAVIGAFVGYQRHVDSELRKADAQACRTDKTLARNQAVVLGFLYRNTQALSSLETADQRYFRRTHQQIAAAIAKLNKTVFCEES